MTAKVRKEIPTNELIKRLRLMGESGGLLTKDRINVVLQAADRIEALDERVAIMMEGGESE